MSATAEKRGRSRGRATKVTTFELPLALLRALDLCADRERRTKKAVLVAALENYLTAVDLWPPAGR